MRKIYLQNCPFGPSVVGSEVVFFADERAYEHFHAGIPASGSFARSHIEMGRIGAPYDVHMVEDAADVLPKYKAAIFASPLPSEMGKKAVELCRKLNIPFLQADLEHCILKYDEIRAFLEGAGVHLYVEGKDVIYAGNGYVGIHAATEGEKVIKLPACWKVTPVFGSTLSECVTDQITLHLDQFETALFAVSAPENK